MEVVKKDSKIALDLKLTEYVTTQLEQAIKEKGRASLVVSGGSTPVNFFQTLSQQPLSWDKITVTLADERCVPITADNSNAKLVKDNLLINQAQNATFVSLFEDNETIEACEARLKQSLFDEPFDIVILGMGGDGHTASIFPEATNRDDALDLNIGNFILKTDPVTVDPLRITLTRKALLNSRHLLLHFTGDSKWKIFEKAKTKEQTTFPISYFIQQKLSPMTVFYTDGD